MIEDLEESVDRFVISMNVAYDSKFHMYIIQQYNKIMSYMEDSNLSEDDKGIFSELVKRIFEKLQETST